MPLMTKAEFSRHRGCSRARVIQWIKSGKVIVTGEGLIDSDKSDSLLESRPWTVQTRFITPKVKPARKTKALPKIAKPKKPEAAKVPKKAKTAKIVKKSETSQEEDKQSSPEIIQPDPPSPPPRDRMTYDKARTAKMAMEAKLKEIELKEKQGSLISKDLVERQAFDLGRKVRDALLNIPGRIGPILAAEKDQQKVHTMLLKEIEAVLEMLAGKKG